MREIEHNNSRPIPNAAEHVPWAVSLPAAWSPQPEAPTFAGEFATDTA